MLSRRVTVAAGAWALAMVAATAAQAQPLGTFRWQLQPYCNIVTVAVTQNGGIYRLEGTDDQCGASASASIIGTAFVNVDGTIGMGLNVVSAPAGQALPVSASISLASLGGSWRDAGGNTGAFVPTPGGGTGGSPRPAPGGGGGGGTITGVIAGVGLSGGGSAGAVTLELRRAGNGAFDLSHFNGFVSNGSGSLGTLSATGPGNRMLWYAGKSAFRAGQVLGSRWDDANIGRFSMAFGEDTLASGDYSSAWGYRNQATGVGSTALGALSVASGTHAVAAGNASIASGAASVAMGILTNAGGIGSVALGSYSTTLPAAHGSFVYADRSTTSPFTSFAANEFLVRAAGGVGFYTNAASTTGLYLAPGGSQWLGLSDMNSKHLFREMDNEAVLAKLAQMPVREWSYLAQDESIRHVGPTAQDFHAAFGLGEDPLRIGTMDADGVALAAAKALEQRTRALDERSQWLERENRMLRERLERETLELRQRIDALERLLRKH